MRGNIDYDQIRSAALAGTGSKFQMFGGGSATAGHLAVYDAAGNVIDGGTVAVDLELVQFHSPILSANLTAPSDTVAVMPGGLLEIASGVVLDLSASTGLTCMEIL